MGEDNRERFKGISMLSARALTLVWFTGDGELARRVICCCVQYSYIQGLF